MSYIVALKEAIVSNISKERVVTTINCQGVKFDNGILEVIDKEGRCAYLIPDHNVLGVTSVFQ